MTATLKFDTRKDAMLAVDVFHTLTRSGVPARFTRLMGRSRRELSFVCDTTATAKFVRNRYFPRSELSWTTTPEERAEHNI